MEIIPGRANAIRVVAQFLETAAQQGVECGVLSSRIAGGLDAVSFGPNIKGNDAPGERVDVRSVEKS
jgi:di/tripeptidase